MNNIVKLRFEKLVDDKNNLDGNFSEEGQQEILDYHTKLVKQVKKARPSLAKEIKDMPMKDFRALWFVVQQGLKVKKENKLN